MRISTITNTISIHRLGTSNSLTSDSVAAKILQPGYRIKKMLLQAARVQIFPYLQMNDRRPWAGRKKTGKPVSTILRSDPFIISLLIYPGYLLLPVGENYQGLKRQPETEQLPFLPGYFSENKAPGTIRHAQYISYRFVL
jgi:hypothetical protein